MRAHLFASLALFVLACGGESTPVTASPPSPAPAASAPPSSPSAPAAPGSSTAPEAPPPPVDARVAGLTAADFGAPLTRAFLRTTNPTLSYDTFEAKWQASLESPVLFVRAFPGGYHADLARVDSRRFVGGEGVCFGDAHPDNLGFLSLGGAPRYVYNDLDDSGYCSPAVDAARWLAVVRLSYPAHAGAALAQYVDAVFDPSRAVTIAPSLVPDLADVADKALDKATSRGLLKLGSDVRAPTAAENAEVRRVLTAEPRTATYTVVDTAVRVRIEGGSGGLRRYWALVDRPGRTRTVLELKEAVTPGADLGRHAQTLTFDARLGVLTSALWGVTPTDDYFYVTAFGARFLVRDRLPRESVDLAKLDSAGVLGVLRTQASVLAAVHRATWRAAGTPRDQVQDWLSTSGATLAARWQAAYDGLKGP